MPLPILVQVARTFDASAEWADYADRTRDGWTDLLGCLAAALD
jgi:hypothetical protein